MSDLSRLKKLKNATNLDEIKKKAESEQKPSYDNNDDGYWKPGFDKEKGLGGAIIRFLPPKEDEGVLPWAKYYSHFINGPTNKKYVENSLTTLGKPDPVSELNSRLWNSGVESDKEVARKQKRRLSYVSNILVIKDPHNPENDGKVFLYRYGEMIHKKLRQAIGMEEDDGLGEEENVIVWDFWEGANFRIKTKMKGDWLNYDDSLFQNPSELYEGDDEKKQEVWDQCHSLEALIAPDKFKSYAELQSRLKEVLGDDVGSGVPVIEGDVSGSRNDAPKAASKPSKTETKDASVDDDDEAEIELEKLLSSESGGDTEENAEESTTESEEDDDEDEFGFLNDI